MFLHKEYINGREIGDNPFSCYCRYCKSRLIVCEIHDHWFVSDEQILTAHQETIESYKEVHDLEDCYLNLKLDTKSFNVKTEYCWTCGWWRLLKTVSISAEEWQIWDIIFGCAGVLKNLDDIDINTPLQEVRNFLTRNYEQRININPKLFQKLVASVFKSLKYNVVVTGYTHDGGIDMILDNSVNQIGVQVKNTRNLIEVEQLRSFLGALLLKNVPEGLFVTTSSFRSTAEKFSNDSANAGIPIKFMNAKEFYEALKIAQINRHMGEFYPFKMDAQSIPFIEYYGWDTPLNSL